jgi:hypothetical protein
MAYVYIHRKVSDDNVFYVGISNSLNYFRAFSKKGRSEFWKRIVRKHKYSVEIIYDNLSWDEARNKEIELIKLYGRLDLKTGILCNLTDGGEGVTNYKHNEERLNKIRSNNTLCKNSNSKKCISFSNGETFDCLKEACIKYDIDYKRQVSYIAKKNYRAEFYYENEYFERITKEQIYKNIGVGRKGDKNNCKKNKVIHILSGKIYNSLKKGCIENNIKYNSEYARVKNNRSNRNFNLI